MSSLIFFISISEKYQRRFFCWNFSLILITGKMPHFFDMTPCQNGSTEVLASHFLFISDDKDKDNHYNNNLPVMNKMAAAEKMTIQQTAANITHHHVNTGIYYYREPCTGVSTWIKWFCSHACVPKSSTYIIYPSLPSTMLYKSVELVVWI